MIFIKKEREYMLDTNKIDTDLIELTKMANGDKEKLQILFNKYFLNIADKLENDWKLTAWQYYLKYSDR